MKIIVFSDSHSDMHNMIRSVEREKPDIIFHLGDYAADRTDLSRLFPSVKSYGVSGNCDRRKDKLSLLLNLDGVSFFLSHGHQYNVKFSLASLYYAALEQNAQIALYGHTHIPRADCFGELTLLNPGTIGKSNPGTYALIETENGSFSYHIVNC